MRGRGQRLAGGQDRPPRAQGNGPRIEWHSPELRSEHTRANDLAGGQPKHQDERGRGDRLKCFVAPQSQRRAQAAGGQRAGKRDGQGARPSGAMPPNSIDSKNSGIESANHEQDAQEAGQQLAQHQFGVGQVGQQQEVKRAAIFFASDGAGGHQRPREEHNRQLHECEDLETESLQKCANSPAPCTTRVPANTCQAVHISSNSAAG